jgi:hypothetical protein
LQIIADIYPPNPHAKIIGSLKCSQFNDLRTVEFVVDSGATFTTLLPFHVTLLGIDLEILEPAPKPCYTATGTPIYPLLLPDVELHLEKNDGKRNSFEIFTLPFIHCMPTLPPNPSNRLSPQRVAINSLLGMDVLSNFSNWHWDFEVGELFLNP